MPVVATAELRAHDASFKIKLIVDDDQDNQALAVSDVEQLVQQDHVVAFVANQEGSLNSGYANYLDQHKVPVLGGNIYTLDWDSDPMFFPQGVTAIEGEQAAVTYAKKLGIKKIGSLACSEAAQCSAANSLLKGLADKGGLDDGRQHDDTICFIDNALRNVVRKVHDLGNYSSRTLYSIFFLILTKNGQNHHAQ